MRNKKLLNCGCRTDDLCDCPKNYNREKESKLKKTKAKIRTEITKGKYYFTESEKTDLSKKLANKHIDKSMIEEEKKSVLSNYKDRLDRFNLEINIISRNIVDGYEMRDFECKIVKSFESHTKDYICIHSGIIIDTRPLDPSDYQQELAI